MKVIILLPWGFLINTSLTLLISNFLKTADNFENNILNVAIRNALTITYLIAYPLQIYLYSV